MKAGSSHIFICLCSTLHRSSLWVCCVLSAHYRISRLYKPNDYSLFLHFFWETRNLQHYLVRLAYKYNTWSFRYAKETEFSRYFKDASMLCVSMTMHSFAPCRAAGSGLLYLSSSPLCRVFLLHLLPGSWGFLSVMEWSTAETPEPRCLRSHYNSTINKLVGRVT